MEVRRVLGLERNGGDGLRGLRDAEARRGADAGRAVFRVAIILYRNVHCADAGHGGPAHHQSKAAAASAGRAAAAASQPGGWRCGAVGPEVVGRAQFR